MCRVQEFRVEGSEGIKALRGSPGLAFRVRMETSGSPDCDPCYSNPQRKRHCSILLTSFLEPVIEGVPAHFPGEVFRSQIGHDVVAALHDCSEIYVSGQGFRVVVGFIGLRPVCEQFVLRFWVEGCWV